MENIFCRAILPFFMMKLTMTIMIIFIVLLSPSLIITVCKNVQRIIIRKWKRWDWMDASSIFLGRWYSRLFLLLYGTHDAIVMLFISCTWTHACTMYLGNHNNHKWYNGAGKKIYFFLYCWLCMQCSKSRHSQIAFL